MSTINSNIKFNNRLGTETNLPAGGTYDLLLIGFPDSFPSGKITFELADTPRKITGIQKVAQVFLKILFTTKGSNVLYPDQGTLFGLLTINANQTSNDTVFMSELNSEIQSAESQTKYSLNNYNSDLASTLQSVTVVGMDTSTERVTIYMNLVTGAGALAQVALPFPELDLKLSE